MIEVMTVLGGILFTVLTLAIVPATWLGLLWLFAWRPRRKRERAAAEWVPPVVHLGQVRWSEPTLRWIAECTDARCEFGRAAGERGEADRLAIDHTIGLDRKTPGAQIVRDWTQQIRPHELPVSTFEGKPITWLLAEDADRYSRQALAVRYIES